MNYFMPMTALSLQDSCATLLEELILEVQGGGAGSNEPTEASSSGSAPSFILVIDGRTLEWALQDELRGSFLELSRKCKAVICCRSTPLQKSKVVHLIRDKLGVMALAVGKNNTAFKFFLSGIQNAVIEIIPTFV